MKSPADSQALLRECNRYNLNYHSALMAQAGLEDESRAASRKSWWDYLIVAIAVALFVWLARSATLPPLALNMRWGAGLCLILAVLLLASGWTLWKRTRLF